MYTTVRVDGGMYIYAMGTDTRGYIAPKGIGGSSVEELHTSRKHRLLIQIQLEPDTQCTSRYLGTSVILGGGGVTLMYQ